MLLRGLLLLGEERGGELVGVEGKRWWLGDGGDGRGRGKGKITDGVFVRKTEVQTVCFVAVEGVVV